MAEGFFFPNANPEQEALARRQALADAIMQRGMAPPGNSPGAGFANAGKSIAGALLAKRLGDKAKDLETQREGSYGKALGNFLSPFDYGGAPNADTGIPDNVNVSPQARAANAGSLGSSAAARLGATANPDLIRQLGPQMAAQMLQRDQPNIKVGPTGVAYDENHLMPGQQVYADPRLKTPELIAQDAAEKLQPGPAPQPSAGMTDAAQAQAIERAKAEAAANFENQLGEKGYRKNVAGTGYDFIPGGPADPAVIARTKEQAPNAWQVLNDKDGTPYRYSASTGQATTLDGSKVYSPQGASKITSGMPRSPATAAFMKWQSENPNASAAEYAQQAGKISQTIAGGRSIGGGQDGAGILAANAASQHLKVYEDLAQAMNNGDVQAINSAKNRWQQEFGTAAPTNAEFANQIVGPELVKAIVAGGGTGAERQEMEKALSTNKSWEQASGLAATAKRLMGGQLAARQKKFTFNGQGSTDDFRKGLEPEAQNILDQFGGSASALPNAPLAAPGGPKPAAQFRYDANGNRVSQ